MEGLVKYADITQFTITNNFTFVFVPYAFGFDYATGDRDNRNRLQECISEVWKILIKMGFTEVKMSKEGAIKAKTFDANGDVEKYWRITIFRDTFETPAQPQSPGTPPLPSRLERTDTSSSVPLPPMGGLQRYETAASSVPLPLMGGLQRYDSAASSVPLHYMGGLQRYETELHEQSAIPPTMPPKLQREYSSSGEPVMYEVADDVPVLPPTKLGRSESVSSAPPTKPPGLQRQITSSSSVGFMRDIEKIDSVPTPPMTRQKTVHFDDQSLDVNGEIRQNIEPDGVEDPHGLVLNVWRLTGEGFEFYDMFKEFKEEILKWK